MAAEDGDEEEVGVGGVAVESDTILKTSVNMWALPGSWVCTYCVIA